ncbi:MAG TPA: SDR family NAD(P)-dependent oxidoreductase, partial [Gaiellaceae bacterium]|nr:SDR family NAD(P)-dependent oxidoreductase [Gaiellaceae bacterium]
MAERFAHEGARVVINSSRSVEEGEALARSLPDAVYVQADVAQEDEAKRLVATALERFGRLDVAVNNAGTTKRVPFNDLDGADDELWERILAVNLMGRGTSAAPRHARCARREARSSTSARSPGSSPVG